MPNALLGADRNGPRNNLFIRVCLEDRQRMGAVLDENLSDEAAQRLEVRLPAILVESEPDELREWRVLDRCDFDLNHAWRGFHIVEIYPVIAAPQRQAFERYRSHRL